MSNFTLEKIDSIQGRQVFEQLVIDGVSQLDEFERLLKVKYQNYVTEFITILSYMAMVANCQSLPNSKFRQLKTQKTDKIKEYEFKSKHLRIYAIDQLNGKIIILGGLKTDQEKDLKKLINRLVN